MQIDRYFGEGGKKVRQQRGHLHRAEGHGQPPDAPILVAIGPGPGSYPRQPPLGEDVGRAPHQLPSGIRQLEAAGRADDRPRAEPCLDPADRLRHGLLSQAAAPAASAKERHSATFAKMASPSRSGSLAMITNFETSDFHSFYF